MIDASLAVHRQLQRQVCLGPHHRMGVEGRAQRGCITVDADAERGPRSRPHAEQLAPPRRVGVHHRTGAHYSVGIYAPDRTGRFVDSEALYQTHTPIMPAPNPSIFHEAMHSIFIPKVMETFAQLKTSAMRETAVEDLVLSMVRTIINWIPAQSIHVL